MVREDGAYANGRVHIELLPAELHGSGCEKQFSLRRIEAVMSEAEQLEYLAKEMLKARRGTRDDGAEPVWCCRLVSLLLLALPCSRFRADLACAVPLSCRWPVHCALSPCALPQANPWSLLLATPSQ